MYTAVNERMIISATWGREAEMLYGKGKFSVDVSLAYV